MDHPSGVIVFDRILSSAGLGNIQGLGISFVGIRDPVIKYKYGVNTRTNIFFPNDMAPPIPLLLNHNSIPLGNKSIKRRGRINVIGYLIYTVYTPGKYILYTIIVGPLAYEYI